VFSESKKAKVEEAKVLIEQQHAIERRLRAYLHVIGRRTR
jgi:hypothetical protein